MKIRDIIKDERSFFPFSGCSKKLHRIDTTGGAECTVEMKQCPHCSKEIQHAAIKCKYCKKFLGGVIYERKKLMGALSKYVWGIFLSFFFLMAIVAIGESTSEIVGYFVIPLIIVWLGVVIFRFVIIFRIGFTLREMNRGAALYQLGAFIIPLGGIIIPLIVSGEVNRYLRRKNEEMPILR